MTQPGLERSLQVVVSAWARPCRNMCSGALVVDLVRPWHRPVSALTLPHDYLVKVSGLSKHLRWFSCSRFPVPRINHSLTFPFLLRTLRLNCLTADYAPAVGGAVRSGVAAGPLDRSGVRPGRARRCRARPGRWPRRCGGIRAAGGAGRARCAGGDDAGAHRRAALRDYRSQFAVLRKYEYKMAFDAEGRKLCGYHQSAGYRQAQLQDQAKAGRRPAQAVEEPLAAVRAVRARPRPPSTGWATTPPPSPDPTASSRLPGPTTSSTPPRSRGVREHADAERRRCLGRRPHGRGKADRSGQGLGRPIGSISK